MAIDKIGALQAFPACRAWLRVIRVGEVPGSNPGAPIFTCKSATFHAPVCGVLVTAEAEWDAPRGDSRLSKVLQIATSTPIVDSTAWFGEVHLSRRAQAGGESLLIHGFARLRPGTAHDLVPNLCPNAPPVASLWTPLALEGQVDAPGHTTRAGGACYRGPGRKT